MIPNMNSSCHNMSPTRLFFVTSSQITFSLDIPQDPPKYYTIGNIKKAIGNKLNINPDQILLSFQQLFLENDDSLISSYLELEDKCKIIVSFVNHVSLNIPKEYFSFGPKKVIKITENDLETISKQSQPDEYANIKIPTEVQIIFNKYHITLSSIIQYHWLVLAILEKSGDLPTFLETFINETESGRNQIPKELEFAFYGEDFLRILPQIREIIPNDFHQNINERYVTEEFDKDYAFVQSLLKRNSFNLTNDNSEEQIKSETQAHLSSIDRILEGIKICRENGLTDIFSFV